MSKKLNSLLLAICMLLCFSACGTTETNSKPTNTPSESQTDTVKDNDENTFSEENNQVSSNTEETNKNDTQTQPSNKQSKPTSTTNQPTHNHSYSNATCTSPKKCSCGVTAGTALGHNYSEANCTTPQICTRCGAINGEALGHSYLAATCTTPKICERCNNVAENALGHEFINKACSRCGKLDRTYLIEDIDYLRCDSALRYEDTPVTDNSGNVYSENLNFYGYAFNYEPSISFDLRGKYSIFNATIFLPYDDRGTHLIGYVKIYGDDKLLYQSEEITMGFKTTNIKIDISGVSILEIEIDPQNSINNVCVPYLTNAYLEK